MIFNPAPAFADSVGIEPITDDRIIRPDSLRVGDQGHNDFVASLPALYANDERRQLIGFFPDMKDHVYRTGRPFTIRKFMEFNDVYPIDGNVFDPNKVDRRLVIVFTARH